MIACKSGDGFGANMVEATVAHMGEVELAIYDGESGAGGSHSVELRMLRGITLNILMSGFEGLEQGILRIDAKGMVVDVAYGLDCDATGLLSAFVTAHAVGDHGEAALTTEFLVGVGLPIEIGILVIAALTADVGQAGRFDPGLCSFAVYCQTEERERVRWNAGATTPDATTRGATNADATNDGAMKCDRETVLSPGHYKGSST